MANRKLSASPLETKIVSYAIVAQFDCDHISTCAVVLLSNPPLFLSLLNSQDCNPFTIELFSFSFKDNSNGTFEQLQVPFLKHTSNIKDLFFMNYSQRQQIRPYHSTFCYKMSSNFPKTLLYLLKTVPLRTHIHLKIFSATPKNILSTTNFNGRGRETKSLQLATQI